MCYFTQYIYTIWCFNTVVNREEGNYAKNNGIFATCLLKMRYNFCLENE